MIFLDETMITKSTIPKLEWSSKRNNIKIDMKDLNRKGIAIIAGVSIEMGTDLVMTFKDSVNIPKFKTYIEELRRKYFFDDLCIYMDNLAVHRSKVIKERLDELSIECIFNPAYSPDLNGVESVFSIFKNLYKRKRL